MAMGAVGMCSLGGKKKYGGMNRLVCDVEVLLLVNLALPCTTVNEFPVMPGL